MGTALFIIGIVISMLVFCMFVASMLWVFINSDSIVIKIIMIIIAITIPTVLIATGLKLGVEIYV